MRALGGGVNRDRNALVPAFIIEELEDGRYTVFVPSIPTPFAGAVYILDRQRVHPVHVPFTDAVRVVSKWGSGAKDLVAAMDRGERAANEHRSASCCPRASLQSFSSISITAL